MIMILHNTLHRPISINKLAWIYGRRASSWVTECLSGNDSFSGNEWVNESLRSPLVSIYVVILHFLTPISLYLRATSSVTSIDWPDCVALTHWLGLFQVLSTHITATLSLRKYHTWQFVWKHHHHRHHQCLSKVGQIICAAVIYGIELL